MNKIVCLSTSPWYPKPTRKQQVMGRLRDSEILYFDPPISVIAPLKDRSLRPLLKAHKNPGQKIGEHITVYSLPPVIPFFNKLRFINRINGRLQAKFIKKVMRAHSFGEDSVIWSYSPSAADILPHLPHRAAVYDCVDRHSAYKGLINPAVVDGMERELAQAADQVFCTANGLYDTLSQYNSTTAMIPNGANCELFGRVEDPTLPFPDELFNIKSPILGFVGALQECIDYSLVEYAAKTRPDWSFVFIGEEKPGADLAGIKSLPNVHLLGLKEHRRLPEYIARFDACLNIFKHDRLTEDVSPLKFYEYLATGKPIVTTPQPRQVLEFSDVVYLADSPESFVSMCAKAISEKSAWSVSKRKELAAGCSWDSRVAAMENILKAGNIF